MSLVDQLLARFKTKPGVWVPGGSIERWVTDNTAHPKTGKPYTASNARRRLREMAEDGILKQDERRHNGTNHAWYCYQPENTTAPPKVEYEYYFDEERKTMVERVKSPV